MNTSMNVTDTAPSANATGMPDRRRISAIATNRMPISFGVMKSRPCRVAARDILDDLHDVFEREEPHAERHQRIGYPQVRRPDRVGGPAFDPGFARVLPDLDGDERAKRERQYVAHEDVPPVPARGHQRLEHFGADVPAQRLRVAGREKRRPPTSPVSALTRLNVRRNADHARGTTLLSKPNA